jgi:hypothetical protein
MKWLLIVWFAAAGSEGWTPARVMSYETEDACMRAGQERVKTDQQAKRFVCMNSDPKEKR